MRLNGVHDLFNDLYTKLTLALFSLVGLLILSGCSAVSPLAINFTPDTLPPEEANAEYRIALGDELEVKFFYNPELNEAVTVRPDGRVSLSLVHEFVAAGRTPSELTEELTNRYAQEFDDPELTVIVRSFNAHRAYVTGEVNEPGEILLDTRLTALQAIARAGDFLPTARRRQVLIIRRDPYAPAPRVVVLDLSGVQNGIGLLEDITLMPYDLVHIPRTNIADVNQFVDQYVRQVIPFDLGIRLDDILYEERHDH